MAKWGEIKCERCDEQDALWEGMERALEESDAREATLNDRITMLEEHLCLTEEKLAKAVAELRKLGEAGKAHGYGSSYIICHNCSDTHHAVDAILAELKGQGDE